MAPRGTFLILEPGKRFSANDIPSLLGRFVTRPDDPNFRGTPENPAAILGNPVVFREQFRVDNFTTERESKASFGLSVSELLRLRFGDSAKPNDTYRFSIKDATCHYYSYRNIDSVFQKLMSDVDVKKDVQKWFNSGDSVFMITRVKSVEPGATISEENLKSHTVGASAVAPVGMFASQGVLPANMLDFKVEGERGTDEAYSLSYSPTEAQIVAIEYHEVIRHRWLNRKSDAQIVKPKNLADHGSLTYGSDKDVETLEPQEFCLSENDLRIIDIEDDDGWRVADYGEDNNVYIYKSTDDQEEEDSD